MKHSMMRKVAAVVAGVVLSGIVTGVAESAAHAAPKGDALFAMVGAAQGLAAVVGAGIAAKLGGSGMLGWVVAALLLVLSLVNVFSFPHPMWFVPLVSLSLGGGAKLGIVLATRGGNQAGG